MRPKKTYVSESNASDAPVLDRHSPVPLYQQLSDVLYQQIKQGVLKAGDSLPSELEMLHRYTVSRYVIRQALANLARQGLIYTEHGRGSFVSGQQVEKTLSVLQSYHKNMRDSGLQVEVTILKKEVTLPSAEVAAQLSLKPDQLTFKLQRLAYSQDMPINLLVSDISLPEPQLRILEKFPGGSLYEYLGETCGVIPHHAQSYLQVSFAGDLESRLLKLPRGSVLLQIISRVYDPEDHPIEYTRIVYPATMFRFFFESKAGASSGEERQKWFPKDGKVTP